MNPKPRQCVHVKVDGVRCGSPSLSEKPHCFFHNRARRIHPSPSFPLCEDANSLHIAIFEVLQALIDESIDPRKANSLLFGLQIAQCNMRHTNFEPWPEKLVLADPMETYLDESLRTLPPDDDGTQCLKVIRESMRGVLPENEIAERTLMIHGEAPDSRQPKSG